MLRPCAANVSLSLRPSIDPGSDSSEDERPNRNTIGDVPLQWYRDEDHVGYDLEVRGGSAGRESRCTQQLAAWPPDQPLTVLRDSKGGKIIRKQRKDALDRLLDRNDSKKVRAAVRAAAYMRLHASQGLIHYAG